MENNYKLFINITAYNNEISKKKIIIFECFCTIISIITTFLNLLSIFIIFFEKGKRNIRQKIQILLCTSFIGIEIRYYPIKWNKAYYIIPNCICFSFIILSNCYQCIYSFIAYKLFTSPEDLSSKCNTFIIYYFPIIIFLITIILLNTNDRLKFISKFIIFSDLSKTSKIIFGLLRTICFLLNILIICMLMKKIKNISKISMPIDKKFAEKKYAIYRSILKWYVIGMIFVILPYALLYFIDFISKKEEKDDDELLKNYYFLFFFFGVECLSGLIFWFIYIFNKNHVRRLLIMLCCRKESDYLIDFIEEKKIHEESVKSILSRNQTIDLSVLTINTDDDKKKQIKEETQEHIIESLTDDETL